MKEFKELSTIETAQLTEEQIAEYSKQIPIQNIRAAIQECKDILTRMGVDY